MPRRVPHNGPAARVLAPDVRASAGELIQGALLALVFLLVLGGAARGVVRGGLVEAQAQHRRASGGRLDVVAAVGTCGGSAFSPRVCGPVLWRLRGFHWCFSALLAYRTECSASRQ